nr:hypothetical protein [Tanacetum cinerariifolium]
RDASAGSTAKAYPEISVPSDFIPQQQVKSLHIEFSKILSTYDFSNSLPTELKELPSKFHEVTKEVKGLKKHVHELEFKLPKDLKEIPSKLEEFTKTVTSLTSQFAELKTLQWERLAEFLPLPTKVEMGENIKKDKGKIAMSLKDAKDESVDSESDDTIDLTGSRIESSRTIKLKKFDFVTKDEDHVHLTIEQIKEQKRIKESTKAEAAKQEVEVRKEELVDLLGPDVVSTYYNDKLKYDNYYDKMLNRRA